MRFGLRERQQTQFDSFVRETNLLGEQIGIAVHRSGYGCLRTANRHNAGQRVGRHVAVWGRQQAGAFDPV